MMGENRKDGFVENAKSEPRPDIRLSTPLLVCFKTGVPVALAATVIGSAVVHFSEKDIGADLLWYLLAGSVFAYWGWRCARLVSVQSVGDQLRFATFFRVHVFPVSDLLEVSVIYRRGLPWAVFRVSGVSGVKSFHTILRPRLDYFWTGNLSDLSVLDGVLVRYKGLWGRERVVTIGNASGKTPPPTPTTHIVRP